MATTKKRVVQFRWFGDDNTTIATSELNENQHNYPPTLTKAKLYSGTAFTELTPIIQLGVQSLPGTRLRLNANIDPIIIGTSGIYELDLTDSSAQLTSIQFEKESLNLIENNPNAYLIIDVVYEEG